MKFGKNFEKNKIEEFHHLYCDYESLKQLIRQVVKQKNEQENSSTLEHVSITSMFNVPYHAISSYDTRIEQGMNTRDPFCEAYEQEIAKVNNFFKTKYEEIEARLSGTFSMMSKIVAQMKEAKKNTELIGDEDWQKMVDVYRREKEVIETDCTLTLSLSKYAEQNAKAFRKIAKKYNKMVSQGSFSWLVSIMSKQQFYEANIEALILAISDVHRLLNWIETKQLVSLQKYLSKEELEAIVANHLESLPDAAPLVQKTETYWIEPELIVQVRIMLAKHIPIILFGKDIKRAEEKKLKRYGTLTKSFWTNLLQSQTIPNSDIKIKVSSLVNSVYYDTQDFECYKNRISKEDNSILLRCSWFDSTEPTKILYMERKINKRLGKSIKHGFEIPIAQLKNFYNGEWTLDEKETEKKFGDKQKAKELLEAAKEVQQLFIDKKMVPTVRAMHLRTRFEENKGAPYKAKLDTHLCFFAESRKSNKSFLSITEPDESSSLPVVRMFPKALLEIRYAMTTQERVPKWINELFSLPGVTKQVFSKFIHSTAACFKEALAIQEPVWFEDSIGATKKKIEHAKPVEEEEEEEEEENNLRTIHAFSRRKSPVDIEDIVPKEKELPRQKPTSTKKLTFAEPEKNLVSFSQSSDRLIIEETLLQPSVNLSTGDAVHIKIKPDEITIDETQPLLGSRGSLPSNKKLPPAVEEKKQSFFENVQNLFAYLCPAIGFNQPPQQQPGNNNGVKDERITKKWIKAAMSNERTLLAWLHPVVVLIGVSISLIGLGTKTVQTFGLVFAVLAIAFSIYALFKFYRRRGAIGSRGWGFDDAIGPTVLVVLLALALFGTALVTIFYNYGWFTTLDWPHNVNDTMIDDKEYQVNMYSSRLYFPLPREFVWKEYYNYVHSIPRVADVTVGTSYYPIAYHEEQLQFNTSNNSGGGFDYALLSVREKLVFDEEQLVFKRTTGSLVEVALKFLGINEPKTFIRPTINFRAPWVYDHEEKMVELMSCGFHSYVYLLRVDLLAPDFFVLGNQTLLPFLQYFDLEQELVPHDLPQKREYIYSISVDMMLRKQTVSGVALNLKYQSEEELIRGHTSHPKSDTVEFNWKLTKFQFNRLQQSANQLHNYICQDFQ